MPDRTVVLLEDVEDCFVPIPVIWNAMLRAHSRGKFRRITEVVRVVTVAGGGQERQVFPAALVRPSGKTRDRRFGDDVERSAFAHMPRGAFDPIKQVSAAWTRQLALGPVHEAV